MKVFDVDNHYYEPYDAFTRHIDPAFEDRTIRVVEGADGRNVVMYGNAPLRYSPAHPMDLVPPPGSDADMFGSGERIDRASEENRMKGSDNPAFMNYEARVRFMDDEGIDGCTVFPSFGVQVEQALAHDVAATYANLTAFNRFIEDDWGYDAGRVYGVPLMSLLDLDLGVAELERVLERGARAVHLRAGPVAGRSPADPYFDPFWSRVNESGVLVMIHASVNIYHEQIASLWGEDPDPRFGQLTPFQFFLGVGERPIADMLAAMTLHGLFSRHDRIRVAAIESGSDWLGHLLERLDHVHMLGGRSRLAPAIGGEPSEILKDRLYISPHWEDDLGALAAVFPADHIMFGSDWPHAEGLAHPRDYIPTAEALGDRYAERVMGGTAASLIGAW